MTEVGAMAALPDTMNARAAATISGGVMDVRLGGTWQITDARPNWKETLGAAKPDRVSVRADDVEFRARVRLDTPREREYFLHGCILPFVLRRLAAA